MAYINTQTLQYPMSEQEIRNAYPNTSFANPFVPPDDYQWVFPKPAPTYDALTQAVREIQPELINGKYQQVWEIVDLDAETIAANQAAAQQALIAQYNAALDKHLDTTAQSKRYTDRFTCAIRAGFQGPYQAEGLAFGQWMDTCNQLAYQMLAEIEAGTRPMFASTDEFIAALPPMVWPQ